MERVPRRVLPLKVEIYSLPNFAPPDKGRRQSAISSKSGKEMADQSCWKSQATQKKSCHTIDALQWNARSLSSQGKLDLLRGFSPGLISIQEFGSPNEEFVETIPFDTVSKTRSKERGGGTALMFNNVHYQITKSVEVNQDSNIYRVVLGNLKIAWLSPIYLNKGSIAQIQALFSCIGRNIPPEEWAVYSSSW